MKTYGSVKVVFDAAGAPWLVVGCNDGSYEAQRVLVTDRRLFDRSWKAVDYVKQVSAAERRAELHEIRTAIEDAVLMFDADVPPAVETPGAGRVVRRLLNAIGAGR